MDVAGYSLPPAQGAAWSRTQNEALAAALAGLPGAHRGLATVPLQDPALAAAELTVAVRDLGLRGAMIDPNALGRPLGDRGVRPVLEGRGGPPRRRSCSIPSCSRRSSGSAVTTCTTWSAIPSRRRWPRPSLIMGGTLDRFPALDVVLVHGGGFLPYHIGRFDRAHQTRPEARADGAGMPSGYLRRFHYDTLVQRPDALGYLVRAVGHDRVVLGSDHPFWMGDPDPLPRRARGAPRCRRGGRDSRRHRGAALPAWTLDDRPADQAQGGFPAPDRARQVRRRLPAAGMLHAAVLRSPHAHARLGAIRAEAALALPGVVAVVTAEDLGAIGRIPVRLGQRAASARRCLQPPLARGRSATSASRWPS